MRRKLIIAALAVLFIGAVLGTSSEWLGTDDTVVGGLAQKAGVHESQLLPWELTGDLQLFVFCAGGAIAGFTVGYYWRTLFGEGPRERVEEVDEPAIADRKAP
jgi:hypothetical protein